MVEQGLTVGLGTDGAMNSDNLNLFEAMRFAALVGKVRFPHEPARWLGAQAAWTLAEQLSPYLATACRAAVATPYPVQRYAAS